MISIICKVVLFKLYTIYFVLCALNAFHYFSNMYTFFFIKLYTIYFVLYVLNGFHYFINMYTFSNKIIYNIFCSISTECLSLFQ